ncbi:alpha/beta fold hydrolase [Acetitomaculum ruminis]|uniref:alpha/beta fold hydrolase n=1 Tax=Acetitomaculum ruminis TaxID=2382 RepID=UPI0015A61131|nr:alpha/beta hydrolase [Acetitomaculum ruminis]
MSKKECFFYNSSDKVTKIAGYCYIPDGEIKAVLQICHGMMEYLERYEEFIFYLVEKGFMVVGNDHLGHGKSILDKEHLGYFCQENPEKVLVKDHYNLKKYIIKNMADKVDFNKICWFNLGHSMGSFILRRYLTHYGNECDGAIIMGTGNADKTSVTLSMFLLDSIEKVKGGMYKSKTLNSIAMYGFSKYFKNSKSSTSWLTHNTDEVKAYMKDPLCNYLFSVNGFKTILKMQINNENRKSLEKIPKDLPVFIVSGSDDPVGKMGVDPIDLFHQYKDLGIRDISLKLYENSRHELLHDIDKEEVYQDLYEFLERHKNK